jgi:molecular chaperone DnaK
MTHATMEYGIDLGTTTSMVGRRTGVDVDVIKNNRNSDITPSAVWIDGRGDLHVGAKAKERCGSDPDNAAAEFKLRMGTSNEKLFVRSGRRMKPEELSAEVLKSLRASVRARSGDELEAAVITVPAAFKANQIEATNTAAQLAGLRHTMLLQEPTAAAHAYAAKSDTDKAFWLVYDFGGGTFDAAIVQVRDGLFTVVNHRGDGHLGGKLIDWAIVEALLIPAIAAQHGLRDVRRDNPRWLFTIAQLKKLAEEGKTELSNGPDSTLLEADLTDDGDGKFAFEYELRRADLDRLAEPFVARSIELCRKALEEKRLGAEAIDQVLMVGGTTLMPYVRERLADARVGLGRPLAYDIDPVSVVARGATIFAGTVKVPERAGPPPAAGTLELDLDLAEVGPDSEPFVTGRLVKHGSPSGPGGLTIEFVNGGTTPAWRSGAIAVKGDGSFATVLRADGKGKQNWFEIVVRDAGGRQQVVRPDRIPYTIAPLDPDPSLPMGIGVELSGHRMKWLAERGAPLPCKEFCQLETTEALRKGEAGAMIRIAIRQGEHPRGDRNTRVGELRIEATNVRRDLPRGTEIQLTVTIDLSQLISATAYVPMLDEEFRKTMHVGNIELPLPATVEKDATDEAARVEDLRGQAGRLGDAHVLQEIERIDRTGAVSDLEHDARRGAADPDALLAAEHKLGELRAQLDELEEALKWPTLEREAEELIEWAHNMVQEHGDRSMVAQLDRLATELRDAIARRDEDVARQRIQTINRLALDAPPQALVYLMWFQELRARLPEMRDELDAHRLIALGEAAIGNEDAVGLERVCMALSRLLAEQSVPGARLSGPNVKEAGR